MDEAKPKSSGFLKRFLSSLILAPAVAACIFYGGVPFYLIMALALTISLREWWGLALKDTHSWAILVGGTLYLCGCFLAFVLLRTAIPDGQWLTISLIIAIWAADSGAYFTGKQFGGPKLAPAISPKKTWAGFLGSMIFCGFFLALCIDGVLFFTDMQPAGLLMGGAVFFGAGLVLGAVGQAGDLLISFFKRRVGIKDTGQLIPGHGGILDRIDALLLAAPVFLFFLWMFPGFDPFVSP